MPRPIALTLRSAAALAAPPAQDHDLPPWAKGAAEAAARASFAPETWRAYGRSWRSFQAFANGSGRQALPAAPATIVAYLVRLGERGKSLSLVNQALAAIAHMHRIRGYDPPPTRAEAVEAHLRGARRLLGRPARGKAPVTLEELRRAVAAIDRSALRGKRDAALLLVGFASALRRSELVALEVADLARSPAGLHGLGGLALRIPRSKTDQLAHGAVVGIARQPEAPELCPVAALADWLRSAGIRAGPIFRSVGAKRALERALHPGAVAEIVKRYLGAAGYAVEPFAAHSLRAGLVTESYRQGLPEAQIMATTRHKSVTTLARYRREADPVARGATGALDYTRTRGAP
jgi:integrase